MNPNNIKLDSIDCIKGVLYILEAHSFRVINLGSDTFGNPIFQKVLQN